VFVTIKAEWAILCFDLDEDFIFEHLVKVAPAAEIVAFGGSLAVGRETGGEGVERTYLDGYVAHAPIETHTAIAEVAEGRCIIWASTQTLFRLQIEAVEALGIVEEKVCVIPPFVGGGFGGKIANQQAVEAACFVKNTGRLVQVAWSRAEEFFFDIFRPAAVVKIDAGVGEGGRI